MVSTSQEQLERLIQRKGEQAPLVQMLRNQIQVEKLDKTFQELYLTGYAKKRFSVGQPYLVRLLVSFFDFCGDSTAN